MTFKSNRGKAGLAPKRKPAPSSDAVSKESPPARTAGSKQPSRPPVARDNRSAPRPQSRAITRKSGQSAPVQANKHTAKPSPATASRQQPKPAGAVVSQPARPVDRQRQKAKGQKSRAQPKSIMDENNQLRVIPLGGMREIGKNMMVYEYGQDMIIVDCGIAFPEDDMPGIDVVIPDFSYILQNKAKLRGIFLTHGHEDHIGALPWLLKEVNVPVYGNSLTIALTRLKLEDRGTGVGRVSLNSVKDGDRVKAGVFEVEFIHTNHSIADANALAIRTPAGTVFHSGDFKIDYTPINGKPMDLSRIAAIGAEGVLLMVCESTNVERPGYTPSESKVGESFAEIFAKATGRIIVATFSSNVFRLQQIISAAENQNRKVALIGRSMLNVFGAANELGYIQMKPDTLIDINHIDRYAANEIVLMSTGSQGEPMSALTRMAFSEHRRVDIIPGDTVVISASPIPGNEKPIYRVINELFKRGAHVIYESLSEIHVSGHAYQEEIKLLHSLVKPHYFVPGHGEYRMLYRHAELAHQLGMEWQNIFILGNGDILQLTEEAAGITGFTNAAGVLIDGSGIGDIDNLVLRDRKLLADDGVVAVFIALDQESGEVLGEPDVQARGFIYESETEKIIKECQRKIGQFARKAQNDNKPLASMIRTGALRDQLRDLLFDRTKRRPIIMVSVIEI